MSWPDEDIDLALEWQAEQDAKCGGCGHPLDETTSSSYRYEAAEVVCQACATQTWRKEAVAEEERDSAGLMVYALRRDKGR
jgi:hypothetical protein